LYFDFFAFDAGMVELADTKDLKSFGPERLVRVQVPLSARKSKEKACPERTNPDIVGMSESRGKKYD
jgi:hypothetical protein